MKGFELALWPNEYKEPGSFQPDARGHISIPVSVLKELSIAFQQKEITVETDTRNNLEYVKLSASAWKNDPSENAKRPVIKAEIRNFSEEKEAAAKKAARAASGPSAPAAAADSGNGWNIPF